eukprot:CAMPEP_0205909334 /NCGR_PEP_ID=MMETSP1325-20131115/3807_1 /ASSEMBLY_ACC=CAM_ASM_000708 /TAXON_ID=236786 /ORGANISM="Florenciella sp., Strain RCC1007" /LENGTH=170 /DNA_ID=CAMNT_0053275619 /DNA_START=188 /DNA_END=701 /DNA_ORIENTATION=+
MRARVDRVLKFLYAVWNQTTAVPSAEAATDKATRRVAEADHLGHVGGDLGVAVRTVDRHWLLSPIVPIDSPSLSVPPLVIAICRIPGWPTLYATPRGHHGVVPYVDRHGLVVMSCVVTKAVAIIASPSSPVTRITSPACTLNGTDTSALATGPEGAGRVSAAIGVLSKMK